MHTTENGVLKDGTLPSPPEYGEPPSLQPPADRIPVTKRPFLLVFETTWLLLIIIPSILYSLFRKIFPRTKSLKDKVILVTGAGRGLGRGLALGFAREGASVAVVDIFPEPALGTVKEITEAGGKAKSYTANVAKIEDIRELHRLVTEDFGPVDILVNNAGLNHSKMLIDITESELRAVVEVNLLSHFWMAKEFLPSMIERNSGHIVAISSASAFLGLANATAYSTCKSGVMGFMDSLREELNLNPTNNIKTTAVFPYFINTSADYLKHFDLRLPALSIEETVKATISGVRRDLVSFTIPGDLFFSMQIFSLFPQNVLDKMRQIFKSRVILPTEEERRMVPTHHIITRLSKK